MKHFIIKLLLWTAYSTAYHTKPAYKVAKKLRNYSFNLDKILGWHVLPTRAPEADTTDQISKFSIWKIMNDTLRKKHTIWTNSTFIVENYGTKSLIEALWLSHGALDVESSDVLPVLLQQWHQEVHSQVDVVDQLFLSHLDMTNSHSQTQNLNMTDDSYKLSSQAQFSQWTKINS